MRKSKYTDEQVAMVLRQAEAGTPVTGICRKLGITETTFYPWKKKFGGLGVPELRELSSFERRIGAWRSRSSESVRTRPPSPSPRGPS